MKKSTIILGVCFIVLLGVIAACYLRVNDIITNAAPDTTADAEMVEISRGGVEIPLFTK